MATNETNRDRDANPDAITGAPGSHPVGTGVGAAGGGAAGAAIGAAVSGPAAPIGAVVGAVVGAVAGGLAGKGAAEAVNPTDEDAYWRNEHRNRPYYQPGTDYDRDLRPAYEYGWTSTAQHSGRRYEEVETDLERGWDKNRGSSSLGWDKAKHATRDAWDRVSTPRTTGTGTAGSSTFGTTTGAGTAGMMDDDNLNTFTTSSRSRYQGRNFDDVETDLRRDWDTHRGTSGKTWESVKDSVRRGWHSVERAMPGDADRDGR